MPDNNGDNLNLLDEGQYSDLQSLHHDLPTNEENSDDEGPQKKVRGPTQKAEIWEMGKSKKIGVTFNKFGKPVGDKGNELMQYLGTLVRMSQHVEIDYPDWRKVPMRKKEDMYLMVKAKFVFYPVETTAIKKWIIYSMGKKWRTWKGSLKTRAYDSSLTIDEIVDNETKKDGRVNPEQFKALVTRWFTPEFQRTCAERRESRKKMKEPHVTGLLMKRCYNIYFDFYCFIIYSNLSIGIKVQIILSREIKNNGVCLTRGELYIKSHTRKNGSIVNDKAAQVVASLKDLENESTNTLTEKDNFSNDDYSKVKGPEKRGYIRLIGRMPMVKESGASSSTEGQSQSVENLKSDLATTKSELATTKLVVSTLLNLFHEHIPNANLSGVLNNLNLQISDSSSAFPNIPLANQRSPGTSGGSN